VNLRILLLILVLTLAAVGTWWLLQHVTPPVMQKPAPATHEPDYYFTDATVTTLDKQGKPEAVMTAPRILHHPDDDSIEVFAPRVEYFIANGQPWHLQADHALMHSGGKLVELDGHVELQHAGNDSGPPLIIHTDKMNVDLNTDIATTADKVEILQGMSRMTGLGMHAYLKDDRIQLESNLRGYYVRKQ